MTPVLHVRGIIVVQPWFNHVTDKMMDRSELVKKVNQVDFIRDLMLQDMFAPVDVTVNIPAKNNNRMTL